MNFLPFMEEEMLSVVHSSLLGS